MSTASSGQKATDSLNGKLVFEQDKNRIVGRDEDNLIRLLILADGSEFVMKVAKEGFDALSATSDQLVFNSDQNVFKIVASGTTSLTPPASWTNNQVIRTTVPHGLSTTPAVLGFVTNPSGLGLAGGTGITLLPSTIFGTQSLPTIPATFGVPFFYSQARSDATNVYIELQNVQGNTLGSYNTFTWNYKYYLLQETAA